MEIIKPEEPPKETRETSIDIDKETRMMKVSIDLDKGPVNAYGTLQFAMEFASRYFTTIEIMKRRADEAEKGKIDGALSRLIVPRR